jgi:hypothetical protein
MWTVYFLIEPQQPEGEAYVFICDIPTQTLAERIADSLKSEGFVFDAWADQD